jgi:hypothetical protein
MTSALRVGKSGMVIADERRMTRKCVEQDTHEGSWRGGGEQHIAGYGEMNKVISRVIDWSKSPYNG